MADDAKKRWEMENSIVESDKIYEFDEEGYNQVLKSKTWEKDPSYFKNVRISAIALLKMVMHAISECNTKEGNFEVIGLLQGRVEGNTFIIMDSFALPVKGSEVRVNPVAESYEYMVEYVENSKSVGRLENCAGWYHSHPGFGCWLSGIDVNTQMTNQQFQDPWLAIVVDPLATISSGKVELGAFRTYPKGYKPPNIRESEYQTIPLEKIEDFGVHANEYYALEHSIFKSSLDSKLLDLLWNKYWVNTLSSSPLIANRDYSARQMGDLAEKLEQAENQLQHSGRFGGLVSEKKKEESQLAKLSRDCSKCSIEQAQGVMTQVIKNILFNFNKK